MNTIIQTHIINTWSDNIILGDGKGFRGTYHIKLDVL